MGGLYGYQAGPNAGGGVMLLAEILQQTMPKPRIKRYHRGWMCVGWCGRIGLGSTPRQAFGAWAWQVHGSAAV